MKDILRVLEDAEENLVVAEKAVKETGEHAQRIQDVRDRADAQWVALYKMVSDLLAALGKTQFVYFTRQPTNRGLSDVSRFCNVPMYEEGDILQIRGVQAARDQIKAGIRCVEELLPKLATDSKDIEGLAKRLQAAVEAFPQQTI